MFFFHTFSFSLGDFCSFSNNIYYVGFVLLVNTLFSQYTYDAYIIFALDPLVGPHVTLWDHVKNMLLEA